MKTAARHLEFERILAAAENASANFSADERNHLVNCADCSLTRRKLENLFSLAPEDCSAPVPQSATANLLNIYQKAKTKSPRNPVRRFAGLLIFDDWKPEFALNERLSFRDTRQFLYRAENCVIDLRLDYADQKCLVSGQLFPEITAAVIRIYNDKYSLETNLNEHGEFDFPTVEEGSFNLQVITANEIIEITNVPSA